MGFLQRGRRWGAPAWLPVMALCLLGGSPATAAVGPAKAASSAAPAATAPARPLSPPARLLSLSAEPAAVRLTGAGARQQLVITGKFSDGTERDLTGSAKYAPDRRRVGVSP